jgi:hypothetical protein
LGLVGTPPSITNHQPSSLAAPPTEIVKAIAPSRGENGDRSQIPTQNRPSPGIVNRVKQLWQYYREYIQVDLPDEVVERSLTTTHEPLSGFLRQPNLPKDGEGLTPRKSAVDVEHQADWIETEVEDLGYARSPIARLLLWLDRVMLKIENWAIKIWQSIGDRICGFFV